MRVKSICYIFIFIWILHGIWEGGELFTCLLISKEIENTFLWYDHYYATHCLKEEVVMLKIMPKDEYERKLFHPMTLIYKLTQ